MRRPTHIYVLKDPHTNAVRYVGKTVRTLKTRLQAHVARSAALKTHKDCWIRGLMALDLRPLIESIEVVEGAEWGEREIFWIAHFRAIGTSLTNQTMGGEGIDAKSLSATWTDERRARQAQITADRNRARTGIGWTPERRQEQCVVRKKAWESQERKSRMSQTMKTIAADPGYREAMSEACKKSWSPARRRAQSEVAKRVNADPERKRRQSELMRALNKRRAVQNTLTKNMSVSTQEIES